MLHVLEQRFPCSPWRDHGGVGEVWKEEGTAEMKCYRLIATPSSHSPVPLDFGGGGRGVTDEGLKSNLLFPMLHPFPRRGMGESVQVFVFVSHHPAVLNWQYIKLIFPNVCFTHGCK